MYKMIVIWLLLTVVIGFGILGFRKLSGLDKWQLTKTVVYAIVCSLVAVVLLGIFVALF
jgi:Na+/H+-dicarboxylate symporter